MLGYELLHIGLKITIKYIPKSLETSGIFMQIAEKITSYLGKKKKILFCFKKASWKPWEKQNKTKHHQNPKTTKYYEKS